MVAAEDEPVLFGEAESFLAGKPERFAKAGFEKSCDGSERLVNTVEPSLPTQGASRRSEIKPTEWLQ